MVNFGVYRYLKMTELAKFFCFRIYRRRRGRGRGQYPAILTEHAWSIKDLLFME